jgi:hypothetical protein
VRQVAAALIHFPVLGRGGEILTTTLTNLDLHDMSRAARTYGLDAMFVVHPLSSQRLLAERILEHWVHGAGGKRIPDRAEALKVLRIVPHLDDARGALGNSTELWTTAATVPADPASPITRYAEARARLEAEGPPVILCFGTGWGLTPDFLQRADLRLEPIVGAKSSGFNHLSVRAACAITLDRLLG